MVLRSFIIIMAFLIAMTTSSVDSPLYDSASQSSLVPDECRTETPSRDEILSIISSQQTIATPDPTVGSTASAIGTTGPVTDATRQEIESTLIELSTCVSEIGLLAQLSFATNEVLAQSVLAGANAAGLPVEQYVDNLISAAGRGFPGGIIVEITLVSADTIDADRVLIVTQNALVDPATGATVSNQGPTQQELVLRRVDGRWLTDVGGRGVFSEVQDTSAATPVLSVAGFSI